MQTSLFYNLCKDNKKNISLSVRSRCRINLILEVLICMHALNKQVTSSIILKYASRITTVHYNNNLLHQTKTISSLIKTLMCKAMPSSTTYQTTSSHVTVPVKIIAASRVQALKKQKKNKVCRCQPLAKGSPSPSPSLFSVTAGNKPVESRQCCVE